MDHPPPIENGRAEVCLYNMFFTQERELVAKPAVSFYQDLFSYFKNPILTLGVQPSPERILRIL